MDENPRATLRGVAFHFKTVTPILKAGLSILLSAAGAWWALHPESFDTVALQGAGTAVNVVLKSSPISVRIGMCAALATYFVYVLCTYYVPCIRSSPFLLFDGRQLRGFGAWGREGTLPLSEVEQVRYRGASAIVRSGTTWLWLPISLLDMDEAHRRATRAMLDEAAS